MFLRSLAAVGCTFAMTGAVHAAPITIDDFSTTTFLALGAPDAGDGSNPVSVTLATPDAIGGERTVVNTRTVGNVNPIGSQVQTVVSGGQASVSLSAGVEGTVEFIWTATGIDLTDGGSNDRIEINVLSTDQAGVTYKLALDDHSRSAAVVDAGIVSFLLSEFGPEDGSDVTTISLMVSGPESFDTSFDFIGVLPADATPVPGPATALLLLTGAAGLGAARKRRV